MTFNQFILKMIRSGYRKYLAYFLCISFSMTVFFMFSSIWLVPEFAEQTSAGTKQIVQIGGIISCGFSIFLITYSYNHFFKSRTRDLGILLSYGLLYRDMKRMIILENSVIFTGALLLAYISGSIFSRLVFMVSTWILGIEGITFTLTLNSYVLTLICFVPIYMIIVIITVGKVRTYSVTSLIKSERISELKNSGSIPMALTGCILILASLVSLYYFTKDPANTESMKQVVLIGLLFCMLGLYWLITHFNSIFIAILKRKESLYFKNILPLSQFASRFSQNRSVMFMVSILSVGIVFFSTVSYTLYNQSYAIADKEQLYDIAIKDYAAIDLAAHLNLDTFQHEEPSVMDLQKLDIVYMEAPLINNSPWRTNPQVVIASVTNANEVLRTSVQISKGSAWVVDFNNSEEAHLYFTDEVLLTQGDQQYTLAVEGSEKLKLFYRYMFAQPVLILLEDSDFQSIARETSIEAIGSIYLIDFENWLDSGGAVAELNNRLEAFFQTAGENQLTALETVKALYPDPFKLYSKYDRYSHTRQVGGFALFIMSFISILFLVTTCVVLYFKVFSDMESDLKSIKLLSSIGVTSAEIKAFLYSKLKLIMILPIFVGSLIGLCLSIAMNFRNVVEMEIPNPIILANGIMVGLAFATIIMLYYIWLKSTYRKMITA